MKFSFRPDLHGIILALLSAMLFGVMNFAVHAGRNEFGILQLAFYRGGVATACLLPFVYLAFLLGGIVRGGDA